MREELYLLTRFCHCHIDLPFKCPGPVLSLINDWFELASSTLDINPRYTASFNDYLRDACFQDIHEETYDIPIGEWPDDPSKYRRKATS
jgi:hypothetical protein